MITGIYILLRERCVGVPWVVRYYGNIAQIGMIHICLSGFYHARASFRTFSSLVTTLNFELYAKKISMCKVDAKLEYNSIQRIEIYVRY